MARLGDPLFHVVVALGAAAAAGGCGETNRSHPTTSSAGAENAGTASSGAGGGGGEGAQLNVGGIAGGGVSNVPAAGAPTDPCAGGVANVAVSIDGGAAGQGGDSADCPSPQLRCATYSPTPTDCVCDRTAPLSACDCSEHSWDCFSFDPPTGCQCSIATGPR